MSCIARLMRYSLLKWLGTILIVVTGFLLAVRLTIKGKVYEQKFYNLIIEEYNFDTIDSKHIDASFVLGFKDKKTAKFYLDKKQEILELISKLILEKLTDINDLTTLKSLVFKALNDANYPVVYVYLANDPKIF